MLDLLGTIPFDDDELDELRKYFYDSVERHEPPILAGGLRHDKNIDLRKLWASGALAARVGGGTDSASTSRVGLDIDEDSEEGGLNMRKR